MPGIGFGGELGSFWDDALVPYVENGTIPEWRVDDAVRLHPATISTPLAHTNSGCACTDTVDRIWPSGQPASRGDLERDELVLPGGRRVLTRRAQGGDGGSHPADRRGLRGAAEEHEQDAPFTDPEGDRDHR